MYDSRLSLKKSGKASEFPQVGPSWTVGPLGLLLKLPTRQCQHCKGL